MMDTQWGIGKARFGMETAVELVPVLGEVTSVAMALFQLRVARTLGVPAGSLLRILFTSLFAGTIGLVPVGGDLFNTVFKVHVRNHRVIEEHVRKTYPGAARSDR